MSKQTDAEMSRIYSISKCKVNLNLTQLLKTDRITTTEFERLKAFSEVGGGFYFLNILMGFIIGLIFYSVSNFNRILISSPDDLLPDVHMVFVGLGMFYACLGHRKPVLLGGLLILVSVLFVPLLFVG